MSKIATELEQALYTIQKEREAMEEALDKAGWERHVSQSLRQDTEINLVVFNRRSDPDWYYSSQGGGWHGYPSIDYDEDDLTWTSRDANDNDLAEGQGSESLIKHLKEVYPQ